MLRQQGDGAGGSGGAQVEDENPYASLEKKSKKGRKQDKFKAAADSSDKKINHSFDILEAFSKLSVEAPLTVSKVYGLLAQSCTPFLPHLSLSSRINYLWCPAASARHGTAVQQARMHRKCDQQDRSLQYQGLCIIYSNPRLTDSSAQYATARARSESSVHRPL